MRQTRARVATIAYIGHAAPDLLPLQGGDILIANAGTAALLSHATNPDALQRYRDAGVHGFSVATLHAKVLATRRSAVIGSANASTHSTGMSEAVVTTTDPATVKGIKDYVRQLQRGAREVNGAFLADARATWDKGRRSAPPGTDAGPPPEDSGFLPAPLHRVIVQTMRSHTPTEAESRAAAAARRGLPRRTGPRGRYTRTWIRYDTSASTLRVGDVLIAVIDWPGEGRWLDPPVVVVREPVAIPRSRDAILYVAEEDTTLDYVAAASVLSSWKSAGVDLRASAIRRVVTARQRQDVLLAPWGLNQSAAPSGPS